MKLETHIFILIIIALIKLPLIAQTSQQVIDPYMNSQLYINNDLLFDRAEKFKAEELFNDSSISLFRDNISKIKLADNVVFWKLLTLTDFGNLKYLEINCPNIDKIIVYFLPSLNSVNQNNVVSELKMARHNNYFYSLIPISKGKLAVKLSIKKFRNCSIMLNSQKSFFKQQRRIKIFYGFSIGIIVLLILYHLILYSSIKENSYLFYVLFAFFSCLIFILSSLNAYSVYYEVFNAILNDFFLISGIVLTISYLQLQKNNKMAFKLLISYLPIILILRIIDIFNPSYFLLILNLNIVFFIIVSIIIISIISYKRNFTSDILFILPWFFLLFGQILFFSSHFKLFEILKGNDFLWKSGALFTVAFMALAFGNKLNLYKNEKNIAEINELKALSERDKIVLEQNEIIESLIKERNKEIIKKIELLANQKNEIEVQNEKIRNSNNQIELINQKLAVKNEEISEQNQALEKHHFQLEEIVAKRNKKLLKEKGKAIVADMLKTSFLNNLNIEIHTPMNAITGFSMQLKNSGLALEKRNEYLTIIKNNIDILLESIDNMVLLARIQSNAIKLKLTTFEFSTLIANSIEYFNERILKYPNKKLEIKTKIADSLQKTLMIADFDKISLSINKLLSFIISLSTIGEIYLSFDLDISESISRKKKNKLIVLLKFEGKDLDVEKIRLIQSHTENTEENKIQINQMSEYSIEISKGLVEIMNGKSTVQINESKEIIFMNKIPIHNI